MPIEALGTCMINQAYVIGETTKYGKCLNLTGQAHEKIATIQGEYVNNARMGYYSNLERSLLDLKEYQSLRKKLENRRLDLDAKLSKVQKAKREKPELEEEVRAAQVKYDDSLAESQARMVMIAESEEYHARDLALLVKSELEYYTKSAEILQPLLEKLNEINNSEMVKKRQSSSNLRNGFSSVGRSSPYSEREYRNYSEDEERVSRSPTTVKEFSERKATTRSALRSRTQERAALPPPIPRRQDTKKRVKCVFEFESNEDDELSIYVGDVITVIKEIDEGWWIGEINEGRNKRSGMFPVNYTEPIAEEKPKIPISHSFDDNDPWEVTENVGSRSSYSQKYEEPQEIEYEEPEYEEPEYEPEPPRPSYRRSNTTSAVPTRGGSNRNPPLPSRNAETPPNPSSRQPPPFPQRSNNTNIPPPRPSGPKPSLASSAPSRNSPLSTQAPRSSPLRNPNNPASAVAAAVNSDDLGLLPECRECGCDEFSANVFKKGTCNNCFHKH
ncbi:BAR-domain-containing protein [Neoconidiobolus thromboides FSU 785]|nr:BAR-domain-containing protein [Neoconidiobolus thromboides FSU 785]